MKIYTILVIILVSLSALQSRKRSHRKKKLNSNGRQKYNSENAKSEEVIPFDLSGSLKRSFASVLRFGPELNEDVVFSPMSALVGLGKLVLGTEGGSSREQLMNAIGVPQAKIKHAFRDLLQDLKQTQGVVLTVANRLFVNESTQLSSTYLEDIKSVFDSTLEKLNFNNPLQASDRINKWVLDATYGKIIDLVKSTDVTVSTMMLLINAIYMLGMWDEPFQKTFVGDFHSKKGIKKIPMMFRRGRYKYTKSTSLNAQIVEIPYESNKVSFVIVLPASANGLPLLLSQLKVGPEMLNEDMKNMTSTFLSLTIPKFKIQSHWDLKDVYKEMGVRDIFSKNSGLTRMTPNTQIFVTNALQSCIIEVNELGSEAAAASKYQIQAVSYQYDAAKVLADRPFMFFVKAGAQQLFIGAFVQP